VCFHTFLFSLSPRPILALFGVTLQGLFDVFSPDECPRFRATWTLLHQQKVEATTARHSAGQEPVPLNPKKGITIVSTFVGYMVVQYAFGFETHLIAAGCIVLILQMVGAVVILQPPGPGTFFLPTKTVFQPTVLDLAHASTKICISDPAVILAHLHDAPPPPPPSSLQPITLGENKPCSEEPLPSQAGRQ
jgi:hypothetical protein